MIKTFKAKEVLFLRAGILIVDLVSLFLLLPLVTHPMQWEEIGEKIKYSIFIGPDHWKPLSQTD